MVEQGHVAVGQLRIEKGNEGHEGGNYHAGPSADARRTAQRAPGELWPCATVGTPRRQIEWHALFETGRSRWEVPAFRAIVSGSVEQGSGKRPTPATQRKRRAER
jgi:hypothetical protein